jgi:thymidylate synthase
MPKDVILTPDGLANLKSELEHLTTTRRREVAARIKEAREFGDISENAEYDDAKNEQAMLEARIALVEDKLRSATVQRIWAPTWSAWDRRSMSERAANRPSTRSSVQLKPVPPR